MNKRKLLILFAVIIVLAGAFFMVKLAFGDRGNSAVASGQRTFDINIVDGKLAGGDSTLKARQNDTVTIKAASTTAEDLHIHGYDKLLELEPNKSAEMTFKADKTGRFEAELHSAHNPIFALEVQPE